MIRLAIVEPGQTGPDYVSTYSRLQGATIVAVVGSDNRHAEALAKELNVSIVAENLQSALEQNGKDFDAVIVHSAGGGTRGNASMAVEAKKHTLLVSPQATSFERADQLVASSRSAHVHLMMCNALRHAPDVLAVHGALEAGKLGDPGLVRIHRWEATRRPNSTNGATTIGSQVWRLASEVDVACWLFDGQPESVYAICAGENEIDTDARDYLQIHLGFARGGMALIDLATLPGGSPYFSLSLIGAGGAAYADDHRNTQLLFQGGNARGLRGAHTDLQLLNQLNEFARIIEADAQLIDSGASALRVIRVARAAIASLESGQAVWLKDDVHRKTQS